MASLISPAATISYPALFTPKLPPNAQPGKEPEYSAVFLFTEEATKTAEWKAMQAAVLAAAKEKWGDKAEDMIRRKALRLPFRTDVEAKNYPEQFVTFISARSKNKPQVVTKYAGADGRPVPLTDEREVFAGAVVRASFRAFAYDTSGNKGVSLGLNNVQLLDSSTPRLDGRKSAQDEFAPLESAPADIGGDDLNTLLG
jgi:Protein of unknown function (DUF2815)